MFLLSQTWWFSGNTAAPQMSLYSSSMLSVSLLPRLKSTLCSLPLKFNPFCFCVQIRHFSLPQALRPAGSADSTREKASFTDSRLRQPRKTQKKTPEENLQIKSCFILNLSISTGLIRECSCTYSAGTAGHMVLAGRGLLQFVTWPN